MAIGMSMAAVESFMDMGLAVDRDLGGFARLATDSSLEITANDTDRLAEAAPYLAPGTQISITFLPNDDFASRVRAAVRVRELGFAPMPHISARRLKSRAELEDFLARLAAEAAIDRAFVVAGDPAVPEGPYEDALAVIRTGLLGGHGIRHVGISGYPESHPQIGHESLWRALIDKQAALADLGHAVSIVTQFGFDAAPVLAWLEELRRRGVTAPVRIGVAGPASVKSLLRFAARCGVGASAKVMAKYGLSLTRLLGSAGPDALIAELANGLDARAHGDVGLHFYPFGGLARTAGWMDEFRRSHGG